jgi:hypothetical protein
MANSAFDPCTECGAKWYGPHAPRCSIAAEKFLKTLAQDGRAVAADNPRCPSCGAVEERWTETVPRHSGDGDSWSISCGDCGRDYEVEFLVSYSFRVRATKPEPIPAPGVSGAHDQPPGETKP